MKAFKKRIFWKYENKEKQKIYLNEKFELIKEILNEEMNQECFDCRKKNPKYISINNAIFLCEDCAQIHKTFPDNISFIIDNNLNLLSNNFLKYLYYGGNRNLDNFINYDYPGLQNYASEILYKTQAMIYYREELKCKIEGKPKPACPKDIMAYKLVSENGLINIREERQFFSKKLSQNKISNKDIINNYYNNYNNTYNTYNNFNYNDENIINNNQSPNKTNKINNDNDNNKSFKYCSLVNKAFFNEMKNLFGTKISNNENNKSYKSICKIKKKFQNYSLINRAVDQSINLNESINYSITNRTNINELNSTNKKINRSSLSFSEDYYNKSPIKCNYSPKYIKPLVKIVHKKKHPLNKYFTDREKIKKKKLTIDLAQITRYNESINSMKKGEISFIAINKQKSNIFKYLKISKDKKNLNELKNNLSFEVDNKNNIKKDLLLDKFNKKSNYCNNYIKIINNQKEKNNNFRTIDNQSMVASKRNYFNNLNYYDKKININIQKINYLSNKKTKKKNNLNYSSCKDLEERKPIKVKLALIFGKNKDNLTKRKFHEEIKKKAFQDKKEQEKLEQEALHNLLFEKKDNDLFTNIIYMNKNDK